MHKTVDKNESMEAKVELWHLAPAPVTNTLLRLDFLITRYLFHNFSNIVHRLVNKENEARKNRLTKLWKLLSLSADGFVWALLLSLSYLCSYAYSVSNDEGGGVIVRRTHDNNGSSVFVHVKFFMFCWLSNVLLVASCKLWLKRVRPHGHSWFYHPGWSPSERDLKNGAGTAPQSKLKKIGRSIRSIRTVLESKTPDQYSLPSGHSSSSMLICVLLMNHLTHFTQNTTTAWKEAHFLMYVCAMVLLFGWVLLVGMSRICTGKHFLSDVVLGYGIGLTVAMSGITLRSLYPHSFIDNNQFLF